MGRNPVQEGLGKEIREEVLEMRKKKEEKKN